MKIKVTVDVEHGKYGEGKFFLAKEVADHATPITIFGLLTQSFSHLLMKMCHVMTNCYKNQLRFSQQEYDVMQMMKEDRPPNAPAKNNLSPAEIVRRAEAVSAARANA